jgi:hypothetical protein
VTSSNVKAIGYEPATQTLTVQFAHSNGAAYSYYGVPPEKWDAIQKCIAEGRSVGAWISANIVRNHQFQMVEVPQ